MRELTVELRIRVNDKGELCSCSCAVKDGDEEVLAQDNDYVAKLGSTSGASPLDPVCGILVDKAMLAIREIENELGTPSPTSGRDLYHRPG